METKVSGYDNLEHVQEPTGHGSEKRLKAKDKKYRWNGNQLFPMGKIMVKDLNLSGKTG